jgi:hypothetical protein
MTYSPPPITQPGGSLGQAGLHPQLHMVEDADASVENQSEKPTIPGCITGHFL